MRTRLFWWAALPALVLCVTAPRGWAQGPKNNPEDQAALQKRAEAFVEAFHKGDALALAAFWTPDGDYTDQTGRQLKGREAITKAFQELFAGHKGLKLRIESTALRFLTPDVAVEDGKTEVVAPDGPPSRVRFTAVHVKKGGDWYLGSVRDAPFTPPSNYEQLRGLEWAIGEWASDSGKGETERLSFAWAEKENFVVATFATTVGDVAVGSATVWIGWDPLGKRVRSWVFDATGGFGEGSWSQDGKKWVVKNNSVLRDGKKMTATYVLGSVDADTITLQAKDRSLDGKAMPDTKEVKLKRVKANNPS